MNDLASPALIQKVLRRLIPFCILCYLLNYIDRSNVSIAEHAMESAIEGFTPDVFFIGASLFFIPYCLLELPSNLIMHRVGARRWIARIMISWGIVSTCFVLVQGPKSFYTLRLLLGAAEAGFFPGILLYLSYWVPRVYRARAAALFMLSQAIAQVVGNVLAATILYVAEKYQFPGPSWHWVFWVEGIPTILVGVWVLFYFTDRPADAQWLTAEERTQLANTMADETKHLHAHNASELVHAFRSPYTWVLSAIFALAVGAYFPVNFFTPKILQTALESSGVIISKAAATQSANGSLVATPSHLVSLYLGLLSAIPFGVAALCMFFYARRSDRRNERKYHLAFAIAALALGLLTVALAPQWFDGVSLVTAKIAGLSLAASGFFCASAVFWAVPAQLLTGTAVAAALAVINSIGNMISATVGPANSIYKWSERTLMLCAAAGATASFLIALFLKLKRTQEANPTPSANAVAATNQPAA